MRGEPFLHETSLCSRVSDMRSALVRKPLSHGSRDNGEAKRVEAGRRQ